MTDKKIIFHLLLLLVRLNIYSQRETDHWYFGYNAALKFDYYNVPVALQDSDISAKFGSSTISNKEGDLLFYTSGSFVYNKQHLKMENGELLASDNEVLQTSIVIPKPNNNSIYYLITLKNSNTPPRFGPLIPSGLYYSVIDITLNGGLGEVIQKNIPLTSLVSEKITAVHAKDGKSIWVISFGKSNSVSSRFSALYAFKIDEDGVDKTPVISELSDAILENTGAIKASPNGKFLLLSNFTNAILTDFDNETGKISTSSFVRITHGEGMASIGSRPNVYGAEFSQDSEYIYLETIDKGENIIFQFNTNDISNRKEVFISSNPKNYMQLAKDGKIYLSTAVSETIGGSYLSTITPPKNKKDTLASFKNNSIFLDNKKVGLGLPNFIQSYFRTRIISESGCVGNYTIFEVDTYATITAASWNFGDGNSSTDINPRHIYNLPGLYTATCKITINNREIFVSREIEVFTVDDFTISNQNIIQCDIDNDGTDFFNLTDIIQYINKQSLITKTGFYTTFLKAQNDIDEITNPKNYESSGRKEIFIRIYNLNGCYVIKSFFIESVFVQLGAIKSIYACPISNNNATITKGAFNLNLKRTEIINNLNLANNIRLRFYPDSHNAQVNQNELDNNFISETTTIWVRADTPLGCGGIESFKVIVNSDIYINLQDSYTICFNPNLKPPVIVSAGATNDSFEWKNSLDNIISTEKDFTLNTIGEFSLTVYKSENGLLCSNSKTFRVINPDKPIFSQISVNTDDETNNIVDIFIDGNSNYEFSLDNLNFFGNATSYTFTKVEPGLRTVNVRDVNTCEQSIQTNVSVIGFKKFFTPNGDGDNDFWNINGLDKAFFKSISVHIFNRYGKIIGVINDFNSQGWDGTFNGKLAAPNNYWFTANIIDKDDKIIKETGNFSLIRN
jgi:gliding motility-associated-like protein